MELTSLDLFYLLKELKTLEGGIISNVYQPDEVIVSLHKEGKIFLTIASHYAYLDHQKAKQDEPPVFSMLLRKHLNRSVIISIEQIGFERILKFTIKRFDQNYHLYLEFF